MELQTYCNRHGISGAELARLVNTSRVTTHRWLKGKNKPSDEKMNRIAEITGGEVTPNDFILPQNGHTHPH